MHSGAADTHYCLYTAEDSDFIASWALHVREVGVGALHQALVFLLLFWRGMEEEVLSERHVLAGRPSLP